MPAARKHHRGIFADGKINHSIGIFGTRGNLTMKLLIIPLTSGDIKHRAVPATVLGAKTTDHQLHIFDSINIEQPRCADKMIGIVNWHTIQQNEILACIAASDDVEWRQRIDSFDTRQIFDRPKHIVTAGGNASNSFGSDCPVTRLNFQIG